MLFQILIGSGLICITIVIQVVFIEIAMKGLQKHAPKFMRHPRLHPPVILLTLSTLWLLAGLSLAIWVWAHAFNLLGAFETLEQSLYFSMVAFTTLGFGDVTLPQDWRLLSGIIAANGLVLFGLNTAFLIETLGRILESND
ncbi:MAG: hypothetical protein COA69_02985 [Robiginitomaculum sp.]|nr:MAG: hypothetical protein COA69_02985 [Robiginitomaculum sp.]